MSGTLLQSFGMVSPLNSFVSPVTGQLDPVAFRFLYNLFNSSASLVNADNELQAQVTTNATAIGALQGDVTTLQGEIGTLQTQVAALPTQAQITAIQSQIDTIVARLAAAGIP